MQRAVWTMIVALFAYLAVAAPAKIIRTQSEDDTDGEEPPAAATAPVVKMAGTRFSPAKVTVDQGTRVVFQNDDVAPHTVTEVGGGVDSGLLNPGGQFAVTVDEPLEYFCAVHPSMTARVELTG